MAAVAGAEQSPYYPFEVAQGQRFKPQGNELFLVRLSQKEQLLIRLGRESDQSGWISVSRRAGLELRNRIVLGLDLDPDSGRLIGVKPVQEGERTVAYWGNYSIGEAGSGSSQLLVASYNIDGMKGRLQQTTLTERGEVQVSEGEKAIAVAGKFGLPAEADWLRSINRWIVSDDPDTFSLMPVQPYKTE